MSANIMISAMFAMVIYQIRKRISDLGFIFNAWWCIVLIGFAIAKETMYEIQSSVWWYIGAGTFNFNIVYICALLGPKRRLTWNRRRIHTEWVCEQEVYRIINYIQYIMFVCMIPMILRTLPTLISEGLLGVRMNYLGNGNTGPAMSTIERIVYIFFGVFPCVAACTMLHAILWSRGKVKLRNIWFDFVNIICIVLISGARTYVFYTAIYFIGSYIMFSHQTKEISYGVYKVIRNNIRVVVFLLGIAGFVITAQRSFSGGMDSVWNNLRDTLIIYFTGSIKVFDIALTSPSAYGLHDLTYGGTLIAGITSVIGYLINALPIVGGGFVRFPTEIAQQYLVNNIWIGPHLSMNAFGTMYYYFMRDFGNVGILIGTGLLALIVAGISKREALDYFSYIIRMQILLLIIFSVCWWEPFRMEYWVITLQALFWYKVAVKYSEKNRIVRKN